MTRISRYTTEADHELLHHENGAHRTTAPTANGSDVAAFDSARLVHRTMHAIDHDQGACGTRTQHTPDRDVNPGPDCAVCGRPRE